MNVRKLYYIHHRLLFLKAWYFLVPALIFTGLAIYGLRSNYETMVQLRNDVFAADQVDGDVETPLTKLRAHVYGHMNTNLSTGASAIKPPIQLKGRYERLRAGEEGRIKAANEQVTNQGTQVCTAQNPGDGVNIARLECIQAYVRQNAVATSGVQESLYKFDFVSPRWSPDLAGYSIVLAALFYILFIARIVLEKMMRHRLN